MSDKVRELIDRVERGEAQASEELLPLVYEQLRDLASRRLANDPAGSSFQTTELVHEAYLRIVGADRQWDGAKHFFAAASEAMRRILVDRARRKKSLKHGGNLRRIDLDSDLPTSQGPTPEEVLVVHSLLDELAAQHPVEAEIVKLHYFAGLNISEVARVLSLSISTTHRYWKFARAWLRDAAE